MASKMTRRELMKLAGVYAAAVTLPGLVYPRRAHAEKYPLAEILKPENYKKATSHWHPIFGPEVETSRFYGGRADFKGHRSYFGDGGGMDFFAHEGTPLVPPAGGAAMEAAALSHRSGVCLRILCERGRIGKNGYDPGTVTSEFRHLYSILVEPRFRFTQSGYDLNENFSYLRRNEVVALSGATGEGPFQGKQHPHVHWETFKREGPYLKANYVAFDQETWGIDKEFPLVFWDCRTTLDYYPVSQFQILERTIQQYAQNRVRHENVAHAEQELFGKLAEFANLSLKHDGKKLDGRQLLDSKYFIDMKDLIKNEVLRKQKYHPGSEPYTAMLELLGHGKDPNQDIIFTLPFISPNLVHLYYKPLGADGVFRQNGGYFYNKHKKFRLRILSDTQSGPRGEEWKAFYELLGPAKKD